MKEPIKFRRVNEDVGSKAAREAVDFVSDTRNGKYTMGKFDLTRITYKRILIQEQDRSLGESDGEIILLGSSYDDLSDC